MIDEAMRSHIRRLFFAEHWKMGTIACQLGVHHDTVERAIEPRSFINVRHRQGAAQLDPYKDFVRVTLDKHPRLCATRLLEMIEDRGYGGSVYALRRYVATVRPTSAHEAFFRLRTLPGEQAQVDWASFGTIRIGRATRKLSCFVLVLSSSRALFAQFCLDQTLESFLRGHIRAFDEMGGTPRTILYDNLKAAVLERHGDHIRFHPKLLELAGHYHFAPLPCAQARGNEKGRVERRIRDLRESFFAARTFTSVDDLNAQLAAWIDRIQRARPVPDDPDKRLVREAFEEERQRLLPLPQAPIACDFVRPVVSGKTPYIRFDRNDYSIPHTHVRKPITLVASDTVVRLLDGTREIARHDRTYDQGRPIEDQNHLDTLAREKRKAREHRGRHRLSSACPSAHVFLGEIALHGGHLGGTTTRLLHLLDQYGAHALDGAIREAHGRGAFAAQSVAHVLDQRRRAEGKPAPLDVVLPDDPRVRDLVVTPHSLDAYDVLAHADAEEGGPDDGSP
jgi:transposase